MLVCQRLHIPHMRDLILGCRIIDEGLGHVVYRQVLCQKTFRRALTRGIHTIPRCTTSPSCVCTVNMPRRRRCVRHTPPCTPRRGLMTWATPVAAARASTLTTVHIR